MNIGVISSDVIPTPPVEYGGIEREAFWLCEALAELGHRVTLFGKDGSRCPPGGEVCTIEGSEPEFVPLFRDRMFSLDGVVDMSHNKCIPREFPDFHPIICTYQVMTVSYPRNAVCISQGQRRHLRGALPAGEDTPVIYYGVDAGAYQLYEGPREDYLLYMGSVLAEKQVHVAIDVAESAGLPIKICGPAWQPEYYDNAIAPRLGEGVEYLGSVGGIEKLDLIQKARALLHPVGALGWVEAGAIIVLETLHCGTPVICSDNGCLPEYIVQGVNGYICHTVREYVEAVRLCEDLDPQKCRRSVRHFRKERMAREYEQLLRDMLAGKRW